MNITKITSRSNPLLVRLRKLARDGDGYRTQGKIWIEGEHLCSACAENGTAPSIAVVSEEAWADPVLHELASRAPEVAVLSADLMASVSALPSPSRIGFVVPWSDDAMVIPDLPSVVLDRVQDAGNVGSILRSAAAFGFRQVIALEGTAGLWSPKVVRSAMGAHFGLHLVESCRASSLSGLAVPLFATSSHATQSILEAELAWPCAWIVGNEGQGVSLPLLHAATSLRIDQPGGQESLNVAVAAALCMYESSRRLQAG